MFRITNIQNDISQCDQTILSFTVWGFALTCNLPLTY